MMIPFEMLIITNYTTVVNLKIYDTLYALILPFTSSIFYTYILKNFFDSISDSLILVRTNRRIEQLALLCGKSWCRWRVRRLMTIILLNGLASWNSFMWPMYVIVSKENRTLPWGLAGLYDRSRFVSRIADGRFFGRRLPGRYSIPVCPQIHCPRRCSRRLEGIKKEYQSQS